MSLLQPFEVLFEERDLPTLELPRALREVYAGELGFPERCLYANFVMTTDGVVAIPSLANSNEVISARNKADHFLMGLLRALADCVFIGAGVLRDSPRGTWRPEKVFPAGAEQFAELRSSLGQPPSPEIAVLTGGGHVDPAHPLFETGALVLTSEQGAARLEGQLPEATTVVTLGESPRVDGRTVVEALYERGHRRILSEAGPHVFGELLDAQVVDELFLTISPRLSGDGGPGTRLHLVEGADLFPLLELEPVSVRRHGAHLFARYRVGGGQSAQ